MRKRPKYKTGDIIEHWTACDGVTDIRYLLITGIENIYWYGAGKYAKHYNILHIGQEETCEIEVSEIDMTEQTWYSNQCREGYRRVPKSA